MRTKTLPPDDLHHLIATATSNDSHAAVAAFGQLVRAYQDMAYACAFSELLDHDGAQDATQDALVIAFEKIGDLRDPGAFPAWLRRIVSNRCRQMQRMRPSTAMPLDAAEDVPSPDDPIHEQVRRRLDRQDITMAIGALTEAQRSVVSLHYINEFSVAEVSRFLGIPATAVTKRLHMARTGLRRSLITVMQEEFAATRPSRNDALSRTLTFAAAIRRGAAEDVRRLLSEMPELASRRINGEHGKTTALHLAAADGNVSIVRMLLDAGADVSARDAGDNATPLHWAAENGHLAVVRLLVDAGADVNANDDGHERGPIGWASCMRTVRHDVVTYLIENGATHDIFSAIAVGDLDAVRALVAADPAVLTARTSRFDYQLDPMEFALCRRDRWPAVPLLFELGIPGYDRVDCDLQMAISLNDRKQVRSMLDAEPDLVRTARFVLLAQTADPETMRLLLSRGVPVDQKERTGGSTRLHNMAWEGNMATAKLLLAHGARLDALDDDFHATPYGWADHGRQADMARFLAMCEILQTNGLPLPALTTDGTPLLDLIDRGNIDGIVAHAAATGTGLSLHAAIAFGLADDVRRYIAAAPPLVNTPLMNRLPLQEAIRFGSHGVMNVLLDHGALVDARTPWGQTLLQYAAAGPLRRPRPADVESVRILLGRGANIAATDQAGCTALHLAARENAAAVVRVLVERGADRGARDGEDRTPLDVAMESGSADAERELSGAG